MQTITKYEQKVLNDMHGLAEKDQAKLSRIVSFIKQEIIGPEPDEKQKTEEFLSVCGACEDGRSVEEQVRDIYSSGKSADRKEESFRESPEGQFYDFSDLAGKLDWKGDALEVQKGLRDEWQ